MLTFDAALAGLTAEEFVERILVERFAVSGAVIGFNFHFGKRRAGSPAISRRGGPASTASRSISCRGSRTTGVRFPPGRFARRLPAGASVRRPSCSAFPGSCPARVIHGDKRGRELGFPTANLRLDAGCGLRHGVYAVRAAIDGRRYDGVANFGRRPMFDSGAVLLEVFLFDFSGDLYGRSIDVAFIDWIREEAVFASVDELTRQMQDDARRARAALARAGDVFPPI